MWETIRLLNLSYVRVSVSNTSPYNTEITRWFKYDRDYLCVNKSQFVPVIFEPPCTFISHKPKCSQCLFRRCVIEETNTVLHVVLLNRHSHKKEHTTFRKIILLLSSGKSRKLKLTVYYPLNWGILFVWTGLPIIRQNSPRNNAPVIHTSCPLPFAPESGRHAQNINLPLA